MRAGCVWHGTGCIAGFGARRGEGTNEQNELPALLFGEAFFEGGHGLMAFADGVEEFAVGYGARAFRIREVGRSGIVGGGIVAVAFAGVAVAMGTAVEINGVGGFEIGAGLCQGILALLGFIGNDPWPVLENSVDNRENDDSE